MTKTERVREWRQQVREIKALGKEQALDMYRTYFNEDPRQGYATLTDMAKRIASANMPA